MKSLGAVVENVRLSNVRTIEIEGDVESQRPLMIDLFTSGGVERGQSRHCILLRGART